MRAPVLGSRPGFTLPEVLIALTMTAIIGAAVTGVMVKQSRVFDQQDKLANARQVSRSAMNILMSELRMVEPAGGLLAASADSITARVPYAMGVSCGSNASLSRTVVSMLPVDSAVFAEAAGGFSGWAYRTGTGAADGYMYAGNPPRSVAKLLTQATCTAAGITTVAGGSVYELRPHVAAAAIGSPVFLFQTVTYRFGPSLDVPGRRALWRRVHQSGMEEELVAPFDSTARFRFFNGVSQVPGDTPPTVIGTLRGVEIVLTGASERPTFTGVADRSDLQTSIFFKNRVD